MKSYKRENPKVKINCCKYLSISLFLSNKNNVPTVIANNKSKKLLLSKSVKNIETIKGDREKWSGTVETKPLREQIDVPVNETLIVELYSK